MRWQYDWAGTQLINKRLLVCSRCYDKPQEQLRAKILSPDPLPIWNARPEPFTTTGYGYDESNIMTMPNPFNQFPNSSIGDFNNDFNNDFANQTYVQSNNFIGVDMLMPDGQTTALMPNNALGTNPQLSGDFNTDYGSDFN